MSNTDVSVAILVGDQVVALSGDPGSVRVAAAMIASQPIDPSQAPVLIPIERGRRETCQLIALGDG
jgi:hypothetical protein